MLFLLLARWLVVGRKRGANPESALFSMLFIGALVGRTALLFNILGSTQTL